MADLPARLAAARGGDRRELARLISLVERGGPEGRAVDRLVWPVTGAALTVGMTGAPGAGKSTLTNALVRRVRADEQRVAVVAVDPTSPFTGGALLGDRVRMADHDLDSGVFVRSMATRGHLGGLALAAPEVVRVLDAAGFGLVLLETVGVGQVEVEVVGQADTTVVVVTPGAGDGVQAAKAGLMEIADVFVLNKADRPGAADTRRDLERVLSFASAEPGGWLPPIVETVAPSGEGVDDLWAALQAHAVWASSSGEAERRRVRRARAEVERIVAALAVERAAAGRSGATFSSLVEAVAARTLDPWSAAEQVLASGVPGSLA